MNECPFCGDRLFWRIGQTTEFVCNTTITETGLAPSIGKDCLKNQLAQQTTLLRRALGVVEWVSEIDFPYGPDAINAKAQALVPDLRAALEEKP